MDNKPYCILYKEGVNQLSLGDVVRVLEILREKNYIIFTNSQKISFFKKLTNKLTKNINNFDKTKYNKKIINLIVGKKIHNCLFDVNYYIKTKTTKIQTFNLFKKILKNLNNEPSKKIIKKKIYKIGFNWITPKEWQIKSYPNEKWLEIESKLKIKKNIKISWQKKNDLLKYIDWIKSCDFIVSIVGLGVHISSFYKKKVLMLTGPTDFYESSLNKNITKIFPYKRCNIHRKKINLYSKNCYCMKYISSQNIYNKILKILKD